MAFNCANLGLNHSIAHQLGAQFHVPHGLANAILLDAVIRFNAFKNRETEQNMRRWRAFAALLPDQTRTKRQSAYFAKES